MEEENLKEKNRRAGERVGAVTESVFLKRMEDRGAFNFNFRIKG